MTRRARSESRVRVPTTYVVAGLAVLAAYYLVPEGRAKLDEEWKVALYLLVSASAAAVVLFGILRYRPRRPLPWYLIFVSQSVYAAGDVTFYIRHDLLGFNRYPSVSDILYLAHYPFLVAALVIFIRRRTPGSDRSALVDAGVLLVTAALLSWVFVVTPAFNASGQDVLARITSAAYPVMDLATLLIVLWLLLGAGRRTRSFWILNAALVLLFATDTIYALQQIHGTYRPGGFLDGMWVGYYLLLGASMLDPSMTELGSPSPVHDLAPRAIRFVGIGLATLTVPTVLLVEEGRYSRYDFRVIVAGIALLFGLVILRLGTMISDQRRIAVTDALTGLRNRRYFEIHYEVDCARARRSNEPLSLVLLDVDYFKSVNDGYGHAAGDRVLSELAGRVRRHLRAGDVLARYGGEEFAVLLFGASTPQANDVADRIREVVSSQPFDVGEGLQVPVTVSAGVVNYPEHVSDPSGLLVAADRAMYAAKSAGRDRSFTGSFDPPSSFLRRRRVDPVIDYLEDLSDRVDIYQAPVEHGSAIARWSVAMAHELGLDESTQHRCDLAARLHDIGKVAVPLHILEKEGRLSAEEWQFIRNHPAQGQLLVSAARDLTDVAEVIGQHHERVDGSGYPLGLAEDGIRIEAKILAVCDTFASMRATRTYRAPISEVEARKRMVEARGTQLSAELVDLFLELLDRQVVGHLGRLSSGARGGRAGVDEQIEAQGRNTGPDAESRATQHEPASSGRG